MSKKSCRVSDDGFGLSPADAWFSLTAKSLRANSCLPCRIGHKCRPPLRPRRRLPSHSRAASCACCTLPVSTLPFPQPSCWLPPFCCHVSSALCARCTLLGHSAPPRSPTPTCRLHHSRLGELPGRRRHRLNHFRFYL